MQIEAPFDTYSTRARLVPALLVLLPPLTALALLTPGVYKSLTSVLTSFGATVAGLMFLAHIVRERGRKIQSSLFRQWGGAPTTSWLRHGDSRIDPNTKERYHRFLEGHVANLKLPTVEEERADPAKADAAYESATNWLIKYTSDDSKFRLVREENASYGFRRNMLGAKPVSLALILVSMVFVGIRGYVTGGFQQATLDEPVSSTLVVLVISAIAWMVFVHDRWVRDAANAYARALLLACEHVNRDK